METLTLIWLGECCSINRCAKDAAYACGMYEPKYPMPTTLLRAYTDLYECVDMRCNYWEPQR